jgi:glycosyltransferase involved in cell wall biosynthesis
MPRIGVGAVALDPRRPSGLNRYTLEILRAFRADGDDSLVAYVSSAELSSRLVGTARLVDAPVLARSDFTGNLLRLLWHQVRLPPAVDRDDLDVFYSPVPEGMLLPRCPQVVTVHDLLPLRFPEVYPRLQHYFRHVLPRILRSSAAIIVDSESTASDLRSRGLANGVPVEVVYPGYDAESFRTVSAERVAQVSRDYGLSEYLLAVGEMRPYKNIRRLIEAFARADLEGVQLAIVGRIGPRDRAILNTAADHGVAERVKFLGFVPDDGLAALYTGALAFVFPSLHEGFGIPPLEAMACGCPVVASRAASIPEVCGAAAVYVDPYDVDSMAAGMEKVVADSALRRSLGRMGVEQASRFSYGTAVVTIRSILKGVAR